MKEKRKRKKRKEKKKERKKKRNYLDSDLGSFGEELVSPDGVLEPQQLHVRTQRQLTQAVHVEFVLVFYDA